MTQDEADVIKLMETVKNYVNPFYLAVVPMQLVNIATGLKASLDVKRSLNTFDEYGQRRHKELMAK